MLEFYCAESWKGHKKWMVIFNSENISKVLYLKKLRGWMSVLETVFVGQCEVFVCLDFA